MPGIAMDGADANGTSDAHTPSQNSGFQYPQGGLFDESIGHTRSERNGSHGINVTVQELKAMWQPTDGDISLHTDGVRAVAESSNKAPPDIVHITHGFFPFARLINRAIQQSWNDLVDIVTDFAGPPLRQHDASSQFTGTDHNVAHGKSDRNQSDELLRRKVRFLEFAQTKRAEFIKLLVLCNWSRRAAEVSRLIDLQAFIRMRYGSYSDVLAFSAAMKSDLIRAQMANPDLSTSLEVLSNGKVGNVPMLGFTSHRYLSTGKILKTILKLNRIIRKRLLLHDSVPVPFAANYSVYNGRAKFVVPSEFEVELSVAEEMESSQFFFVGLRFLFSPTSDIPKGKLLNNLDRRVNASLVRSGLIGCYNFLHDLALTVKIIILFRQALDLSQGLWSDTLRVELLRRTLVVQYWSHKSGPKNWIELGISRPDESGCKRHLESFRTPYLRLKWIRDGVEHDPNDVHVDFESLSMESILRSVTSLHISYLLLSTYRRLRECPLYKQNSLSISMNASAVEPGNCCLDVELTQAQLLKVTMDHVNGTTVLRAISPVTVQYVNETEPDRSIADQIFSRICRLRCSIVREEVESYFRLAGWERIEPQHVNSADIEQFFPSSTIRYLLFSRPKQWLPNWTVAFVSGVDGDSWWIVHLRENQALEIPFPEPLCLDSVYPVRHGDLDSIRPLCFLSFGKFAKLLSEIVEVQANVVDLARFRVSLPTQHELCRGRHPRSLGFRLPQLDIFPSSQLYPRTGMASRSSIKSTIRLSLHAIDSGLSCATMLVRGRFNDHIASLGTFTRETYREVTTRCNPTQFGMYFRVPIGRSIVFPLLVQIQQLEIVISTLKCLEARRFTIRSVSLTRIDFVYGKSSRLRASIRFKQHFSDATHSVGYPDFRPSMDLYFPPTNPHRRIEESLVNILNDPRGGLDSVLSLLVVTTTLLHALDPMCCRRRPHDKINLSIQLSTRDARVYRFRYPHIPFRFSMYLRRHRSRLVWVLQCVAESNGQQKQMSLERLLSSHLYGSRGNGWVGLRNGAASEIESVGDLLGALDRLIHGNIDDACQHIEASAPPGQIEVTGKGDSTLSETGNASSKVNNLQEDVILID